MRLSAKAARFVERALRDSSPGLVSAWTEQAKEELSPDAVRLALDALTRCETGMKARLSNKYLSEDERSDMVNDLRFIAAIEKDLGRELAHGRHVAA